MTGAVIVFVNRVEDFQKVAQAKTAELEAAQRNHTESVNAANNQRASAEAREVAANARVASMQQDLLKTQQQLAASNVELADKSKQLALTSLQVTQLSEGLKASEATKAQLLANVKQLRDVTDDVTKKNSELNKANSELTNTLDQ